MSENYNSEHVLDLESFRTVENRSSEVADSDGKLVNLPDSEDVPVVQFPAPDEEESNGFVDSETSVDTSQVSNGADDIVGGREIPLHRSSAEVNSFDVADGVNQEPGSLKTDNFSHNDGVGDSNYVKVAEDAGKEDMFVDASDELTVYDGRNVDNREALATSESQLGLDEKNNNMQETSFRECDNGMQVRQLMDEVERLWVMLEQTVGEKESIARECKEERETFLKEVAKLNHQFKALTDHQSLLVDNDDRLVDHLHKVEMGDSEEKTQISNTPLHQMINECSDFLKSALAERSQTEGTIRELQAILFMKDQEIEDLNAKVTELSVSHDIFASYLNSAKEIWSQSLIESSEVQLEKDRHIEVVSSRLLASLAMEINQEEFLDGPITSKISHIEKVTSMLIENYKQLLSESSELRGKEADLVEKLSYLEDENKKFVEQLDKSKEIAEMASAELGKTKIELEREKNKCANVKEKLSLAVTKGKALVQQRDSLRQSLADKTSELEKCLIELQEKSSALEAAELSKVELTKSDNLVASLQESLLQRDTILEKFEEILSQTAVPAGLQSADIMDRVRWLVDDRNVLTGVSLEFYKVRDSLSLIDLPENISSSDLESQVSWLGESFCSTRDELSRLKDEIARMREAAYNEIDRLTASLSAEIQDKDYLQKELEDLTCKYEEIIEKEHQASLEKDRIVRMLVEASGITLDDQEGVYQLSFDMAVLVDRCFRKIKEQSVASLEISHIEQETFERIQSVLYVRNQELMLCEKLLEEEMLGRSEVDHLSNELKVASQELLELKDEKSSLQKDLERSEQKSSLLREKLSMAVKKGKGLVQERENLKVLLDEKKTEIEKLKLELQQQESSLADCRDHINRLSTDVECIPKLENDLGAMKDQRDQLEQFLVESNNMLQKVIESIDSIVLPDGSVFEEPVEKVIWLARYFSECQFAMTQAEQELGKLKEEASTLTSKLTEATTTIKSLEGALSVSENNVSQLAEERRELEVGKAYVEQELQKAIEEANSLMSKFSEACATRKSLEDESGKVKEEARTLGLKLVEANTTIKSLEDALSVSENNIFRLAEERRELEVDKAYVEQELQKAIEEANSRSSKFSEGCMTRKSLEDALSRAENDISVLSNEKEDAQAHRAAAETELEKAKEKIASQTGELTVAYNTIKSLEDALSQVKNNVALLTEEKNDVQVGRTDLEDELKKLREEACSQASKLADAQATIKSLEDALLRAENNISVLVSEKNIAEQEMLTLNSKLNACMEELVGTRGSLESRLREFVGHLNSLQMLMKDETLFSLLRRSFDEKFKSLKDVDVLLKNLRDHFVDVGSGLPQNHPVTEVDSYVAKLISDDPDNIVSVELDSCDLDVADADNISSYFIKTVEGFHLRNKTLADKFEGFSTFMDEFIASLLKELQATWDEVIVMLELMESLKQKVKSMEIHKQEQENTMAILENDIALLLSACSNATQELQYEVENILPEADSIPELVTVNSSLFVEKNDVDGDAAEPRKRFDGNQYVEMAEKLLFAAKNSRTLIRQFENIKNALVTVIEDLRNKLVETQRTSEKALEERDLNQDKISKLESDVEALQNLCTKMELELEDCQAREAEMKEREAELSSLHSSLLTNQHEAECSLLSASEVKVLFEKINGITMPFAETELGDQELHNSAHVEKLFYIIDSVPELQRQIKLLSHDKEELQSNLATQVFEIKHLNKEVETEINDKHDFEKLKRELFELALGLEKIIQKFGGSDLVGDHKPAHAGELLALLEKLVTAIILESENSKSKEEELGAKLFGSQKLVDELSTKVKLLEGSIQGRAAPPETLQERSIYEAPSVPSGSEISEIEDVGSVGKNTISSVPLAAHVRTMRKGSSDHLALNIDLDSDRLISNEETVEDKGHVFKSLNTSGLIPKQGKMIADRIDGIWVSGGRVLMSRPRARLGLIAYWLFLHIWLLGTIL